MLCRRILQQSSFLRKLSAVRTGLCPGRSFHDDFSNPKPLDTKISRAVETKYKIFRDEDASEILDVEEEKYRIQQEEADVSPDLDVAQQKKLQRGLTGVFDIEDLVVLLRKESAGDIIVCSVPKHIKYVDYMCIVTGRSFRHMKAMAEHVRKIYKLKRGKGDILPKLEGETSRDWMALDLGNIALHIFSEEARQLYDLESLWSIGPEFDKECNKPEDPLIELFQQHSAYLDKLEPKTS